MNRVPGEQGFCLLYTALCLAKISRGVEPLQIDKRVIGGGCRGKGCVIPPGLYWLKLTYVKSSQAFAARGASVYRGFIG